MPDWRRTKRVFRMLKGLKHLGCVNLLNGFLTHSRANHTTWFSQELSKLPNLQRLNVPNHEFSDRFKSEYKARNLAVLLSTVKNLKSLIVHVDIDTDKVDFQSKLESVYSAIGGLVNLEYLHLIGRNLAWSTEHLGKLTFWIRR